MELTLSSRIKNSEKDEATQAKKLGLDLDDPVVSQYIADAKFVMRKQSK